MATSYLAILAGRITEVLFAIAGGTQNANKAPVLDASGRLTLDMMPAGIGPDTDTFTASEVLAAGAWVSVNRTAGTVRNANASGIGTRADGYVIAGVAQNAQATVYFDDNNSALTGLTVGDYWLSTTPGTGTTTPPTGANIISQRLGVAVSTTTIHASIGEPVILAQ
jgi:hypothetical protein